MVNGVSGQRYHVRPLLIAVDVKAVDFAAFVLAGEARTVLPEDYLKTTGYEARK